MTERTTDDRARAWLDRYDPFLSGGAELPAGWGPAATCAWILAREHLGREGAVAEERHALLVARLQRHQDEATGFFKPSRDVDSTPSTHHDHLGNPATRALTAFALNTFVRLGRRPSYDLHVLRGLENVGGPAAWLEGLDWANPALTADDIASVCLCLIYQAEIGGERAAVRAYHSLLDLIEAQQDPRTGLFGVSTSTFPWRSLVASDCLIPLFAYVHRPVQRVARIVDTILSLADSDDGLARTRGSARDALAALRVLILLGRQSTYRRDDVREMVTRSSRAIEASQQEDGSFSEVEASAPGSRLFSAPISKPGATQLLYALWLRVLAMAAADEAGRADVPDWSPADWPGLDYICTRPALSQHEHAVLPLWIRETAYSDVPPIPDGAPPALSVVVPCYNLGIFLHEAIESVLAQTCRDFEIVIVDDGSNDAYTRLLLEHFERPRTRVVRQENCGLPVARNAGIRQSSGRYVCCLDPDDRLRPEFFSRACELLDGDSAVGFVSGHFEMFDEGDGVFRYDTCEFPALLVHNRAIEPAVFRRAGWERVGGYCTTFSTSGIEDWDFWIELLEAGYRAEVIQDTVWDYRIRADQMSTRMYQPETWGRLVEELVQRHPESYRRHMAAVMGGFAARWADVRGWADGRNAALGWWQRQAGNWERLAAKREGLIQALQATVLTLEHTRQAPSKDPGSDA